MIEAPSVRVEDGVWSSAAHTQTVGGGDLYFGWVTIAIHVIDERLDGPTELVGAAVEVAKGPPTQDESFGWHALLRSLNKPLRGHLCAGRSRRTTHRYAHRGG